MNNPKKIKYSGQFIVRWRDQSGIDRRKSYTVYKDAQKALKWLIDNGSTYVDIAVSRESLRMDTELITRQDET